MRTNTRYYINEQLVDIHELMRQYNGNVVAVCNHISNQYLVKLETAQFYVDLYLKDKPFKEKDSALSAVACGFCLPLVLCAPVFLAVICVIVSSVLAIVDLATKGSEEIPHKHWGSIVALVICGISVLSVMSAIPFKIIN